LMLAQKNGHTAVFEAFASRLADQRLQAFAGKYGINGWINWDKLVANPFVHEGMAYLFNAEFARMITPASGIFANGAANVLVSDIPRNAFTTPGRIMLAGKVLGATNIKNQFGGETSVPHIKYLGHIVCQNSDCGGYYNANLK
jgi:hypothetical protein